MVTKKKPLRNQIVSYIICELINYILKHMCALISHETKRFPRVIPEFSSELVNENINKQRHHFLEFFFFVTTCCKMKSMSLG